MQSRMLDAGGTIAQKSEMGSGPWLAELQWIVEEIFAAAPAGSFTDAEYSVCEVYIDAPPHISATDRVFW